MMLQIYTLIVVYTRIEYLISFIFLLLKFMILNKDDVINYLENVQIYYMLI